jgi:hypothetical protein
LEILAFIGVLAIAYALWLAIRFRNFRKRLLDAFEFHGVPREVANNLYTIHNGVINDLHVNRGLSPELIAIAILDDFRG